MIDRSHELSITRQAELLGISCGSVLPRPLSESDLRLMRRLDELHLEHPFMGARCCATDCSAGASRWAASMSLR